MKNHRLDKADLGTKVNFVLIHISVTSKRRSKKKKQDNQHPIITLYGYLSDSIHKAFDVYVIK